MIEADKSSSMSSKDEKTHLTTDWMPPPNGDPPRTKGRAHSGRLSIRCIKGANIRRKDQNRIRTSIQPCLRFTLGPGCTTAIKKIMNSNVSVKDHNPSFGNTNVSFDVANPYDYIKNNDIKLKIEVLDKTVRGLEELGEVTISALRLFTDKAYNATEWFPIRQRGDKTSNSTIYLEITFHPVKQGVFMLSLLKYSETLDNSLNLFFKVGDHPPKETKIINRDNPKQPTTKIYLNISRDNWFDDLIIQVGNDATSQNKLFSEKCIDLLQFMTDKIGPENDSRPISVELSQEKAGEGIVLMKLDMSISFLQAGELTIRNICAKPSIHGCEKFNPLVLFRSVGRASIAQAKTKPTKGGDIWRWNDELSLLVTDNHILEIECFDNDAFNGNHDLIGKSELSLLPVFQMGHIENNIQLKIDNEVCFHR